MDPLTETIIRKVQANFKDATGEAARQIIGEEIVRFLKDGAGAEEEDIGALEDAIRNRLAGRRGASGRTEKLEKLGKKGHFSTDEWGRIALFMAFMAKEDEARGAAAAAAAKRATHAQLEGQAAAAAQRK